VKIKHRSKLVQIIMSVSKIFAGRKKECSVWEYFEYDEKSDSSECVTFFGDWDADMWPKKSYGEISRKQSLFEIKFAHCRLLEHKLIVS